MRKAVQVLDSLELFQTESFLSELTQLFQCQKKYVSHYFSMIEKKCPLKLCFFVLKSCYTVLYAVATNSLIYESFVVLFVLFSTLSIFNCIILVVLSGCRTFCIVEILTISYLINIPISAHIHNYFYYTVNPHPLHQNKT
jgi:hypothetical protein